jgi:hypothetical protein
MLQSVPHLRCKLDVFEDLKGEDQGLFQPNLGICLEALRKFKKIVINFIRNA